MLSYMLPTEEKPPPDNRNGGNVVSSVKIVRGNYQTNDVKQKIGTGSQNATFNDRTINALQTSFEGSRTIVSDKIKDIEEIDEIDEIGKRCGDVNGDNYYGDGGGDGVTGSPRNYDNTINSMKKTTSTGYYCGTGGRTVVKDDSLYSIGSDASSTVGSEKKHKLFNGAKHASLKRVSFGSSKGSMVETLVFETPVQEEPENNHFIEHNGRVPGPMSFGSPLLLPPDTDEGRERVRVSLLEPTPCPSTPGVLLLEPTTVDLDEHLNPVLTMATSPAELLTAHTEHTTPTYHTQISTDSGWDNPFRPDGDLSREADEIVELIKGGKPITPTPGQNPPSLPGVETATQLNSTAPITASGDIDSGSSKLLNSTSLANQQSSPRLLNNGNGNANGNTNSNSTPIKGGINANNGNNQHAVANEKVATSVNASTVEVGRVTAQGPGDASQVEHVTLKKKPKCKCCVLQ